MRSGRRDNQASGFTLIEVMAAVVIFGLFAATLTSASIATIKTNTLSRQTSAAAALIHDKIEQLRALDPRLDPADLLAGSHVDPLNPMTDLGKAGGMYDRSWSIVSETPVSGLSLLTVEVSWENDGQKTVRVETYLCDNEECSP